ncbi:MAG: hypothetical protein HY898_24685 [Deltaproteobacteria bacterium]|nr:hypothetical protein [Deltaproteobacteria bacterium]
MAEGPGTRALGIDERGRGNRARWFSIAVIGLVILEIGLAVHTERHARLFSGEPLSMLDYDTHAEQMMRATDAMARWGRTWAYDPQLLAGYPTGMFFEADNKGWELWTFLLWKAGVARSTAFNLLLLVAHLLPGPVIYAAGRLFRLDRWDALAAAYLAVGLWFFDGMTRWAWVSGAVAFCLAALLSVLPMGMLYRFVRGESWSWVVALALTLGLLHMLHPGTFVFLVVPLTAMVVRAGRSMPLQRHFAIGAAALFTIGLNFGWLSTAFRFAPYLTDHQPFFVGTASFLLSDWAGVTRDIMTTGPIDNRTAFKFLAWGLAGVGLWHGRRTCDDRWLPMAASLVTLLGLAYLGGYFWVLRSIQQYRCVVPAAMLACLPAGALVGHAVRSGAVRNATGVVRGLLGVGALLAGSCLAQDVVAFLPIPVPRQMPGVRVFPPFLAALGFKEEHGIRHQPPKKDFAQVAAWVRENDDGQGRILVEWWTLAEYLLSRSRAQVLGGFPERNSEHAAANLFARRHHPDRTAHATERFFEQYAVRWVILTFIDDKSESFEGLLDLVIEIPPHRVYRTRTSGNLLAEGAGRVTWGLNRIDVAGSDPESDLVLRFHWMSTLQCQPGCVLKREPLSADKVGFMRIAAPHPAELSVVNSY